MRRKQVKLYKEARQWWCKPFIPAQETEAGGTLVQGQPCLEELVPEKATKLQTNSTLKTKQNVQRNNQEIQDTLQHASEM